MLFYFPYLSTMNRTFTGEKSECCHDSKMQANLDGKKMEESSELQS